MKSKIYNQDGKEVEIATLPETVFNAPWNADLVHQVVVSMQANARTPVAHAKTRAEVRGGGIKPWRQKGTGRARHGSIRSPIWVGGGVTHGPRNDKNYSRKINKKMKTKALFSILSKKMADGEVLLVDAFSFTEPKTSEAKKVISALSTIKGFSGVSARKKNAAYLALSKKDDKTLKSFRNFKNIKVDAARNLNPVDVLSYKYLIITEPKEAAEFLESKLGTK